MRLFTTVIETKAQVRFGRVDLTDDLAAAIEEAGAVDGIAMVFCRHTTCVLVVNESEAGSFRDVERALNEVAPRDRYYAHDDMTIRTANLQPGNEPANGPAHVLATMLGGTSQMVPIADGKPGLGRWQRLMLLELDDPRPRDVAVSILA